MQNCDTEYISKQNLPEDFTSAVDNYMTNLKEKETTHIKSTDVDKLREKWITHHRKLPERTQFAINNARRIAAQAKRRYIT